MEASGLQPFSSLDEIRRAAEDVQAQRRAARARSEAARLEECRAWTKADNVVGVDCSAPLVETVTVTGMPSESITNLQHEGVDEGDIVKRRGDTLVVLRRGRLFTIRIDGTALDAVDVADADGDGSSDADDPRAWYDELLVWQDTAVVIGYNYGRGGTEIGLFDLSSRGRITHRATYHLRSDDYYSASDYASRLIGHTLVLSASGGISEADPAAWLPALRKWHRRGAPAEFRTIAPVRRTFRSPRPLGPFASVHTQIVCDLAAPELRCEATVLLGETLALRYTSPTATYIWTDPSDPDKSEDARLLYRVPLDGGAIGVVGVRGLPVDQLAFRERADGRIDVVAPAEDGVTSLLRIPAAAFTGRGDDLPETSYQPIARDFGRWPIAQFIGEQVVVASSGEAESAGPGRIAVVDALTGIRHDLALTHGVERIEALGADAVVVGQEDEALRITTLALGAAPRVVSTWLVDRASQGESRSHGFFYRRDGEGHGVFGLPITTSDSWNERAPETARIVFVAQRDLALTSSGELTADPARIEDDGCRVSCADWYGNARPLFLGDRIFALMGYELVEGRMSGGHVAEVRRLDFSPAGSRRR